MLLVGLQEVTLALRSPFFYWGITTAQESRAMTKVTVWVVVKVGLELFFYTLLRDSGHSSYEVTKAEGWVICSNTAFIHRCSQLVQTLAGPGFAADRSSAFDHSQLAVQSTRQLALSYWPEWENVLGAKCQTPKWHLCSLWVLLFKCSSEARVTNSMDWELGSVIIKVWESDMSFQDSQALANSEVMCELSLPIEQKAGQGGGRGGIALMTCWAQPEAGHAGRRLERAEAEPGRQGRRPALSSKPDGHADK